MMSTRRTLPLIRSFTRTCHSKTNTTGSFVPFGSENVSKEDKPKKVTDLFSNVAKKYDIMNDFMSFGIHRCWKSHLVESRITPSPKHRILDVGGGTGDIAMRIIQFMRSQTTIIEGGVTVVDPTEPMMNVGKERAAAEGMSRSIDWVVGTGENLPVEDNEFNAVTMAFSIRNCTEPNKAIEQAYRVLKPGGRFYILEFFKVDDFPIAPVYNLYLDFLPVTGFITTGNWGAYQYLADSIRRFNTQDQLMAHMRKSGFVAVNCERLPPFGVACILSGLKPDHDHHHLDREDENENQNS